MFMLVPAGPERSDCTAPYKVILDKKYTVRTFIKEVLKRKGEWGYIRIKNKDASMGVAVFEYRYGKLLSKRKKDILDKPIISVKADGGYSSMDYLLKI